jgi:hypothetical protein
LVTGSSCCSARRVIRYRLPSTSDSRLRCCSKLMPGLPLTRLAPRSQVQEVLLFIHHSCISPLSPPLTPHWSRSLQGWWSPRHLLWLVGDLFCVVLSSPAAHDTLVLFRCGSTNTSVRPAGSVLLPGRVRALCRNVASAAPSLALIHLQDGSLRQLIVVCFFIALAISFVALTPPARRRSSPHAC